MQKKGGGEPMEIFEAALRNARPQMEVRSRRVGGANYQVPREVRPERRLALSLRWLIGAARKQKEHQCTKHWQKNYACSSRGRRRSEEEGRYAQDGGS